MQQFNCYGLKKQQKHDNNVFKKLSWILSRNYEEFLRASIEDSDPVYGQQSEHWLSPLTTSAHSLVIQLKSVV